MRFINLLAIRMKWMDQTGIVVPNRSTQITFYTEMFDTIHFVSPSNVFALFS